MIRADVYHGDCVSGMAERLEADSVSLCVTSIPFESLFVYSGKTEDVGNNGTTTDIRAGRFALNMRFFSEQLLRVLMPGCNACIHLQQLLSYKNQHGYMGRRDFRGAMVDVLSAAGFIWTGEFAIAKNPQTIAQRLKLHSLQFKTGYHRNSCNLAPAPNDYVLIFQKPGDHPRPPRSILDKKKNPGGWVTTEEWIRDACGTWTDIVEMDVLENFKQGKENDREKHVCALQLEVIRRLVQLYSNPVAIDPDVLILDPFMGIGSTAHVCLGAPSPVTKLALEEPRNVVGFELKDSYHALCLENIDRARKLMESRAESDRTMFDQLEKVHA